MAPIWRCCSVRGANPRNEMRCIDVLRAPCCLIGVGRAFGPPCGNIGQDDEDLLYRGIHRSIAQAMPAMANANGILEIVIKCREDSTTQMHELKRTCSL